MSLAVALEAKRRGAPDGVAVQLARDVVGRLVELPGTPDLIDVLMNIEYVMRDYGYPAS